MREHTILHIVSLGFVGLTVILWILDSFPSVFVALLLAFVTAIINGVRHVRDDPPSVDSDIVRLNSDLRSQSPVGRDSREAPGEGPRPTTRQ